MPTRATVCLIALILSLTAPVAAESKRESEPAAPDRQPASYRPPSIQKTLEGEKPVSPNEEPALHPVDVTTTQPTNAEPERSETILGSWAGRKALSEKGLDIAVIDKTEAGQLLAGGAERRSWVLQNLDLRLAVDAEKLLGWKGTSFFFYGLGDWGADEGQRPSRFVRDIQGTSNIETQTDTFRLYEAWVQHLFSEDRVSILAGLHDLNSEFYVTDSSSLFLNASFGIGRELSQTAVNGPSIFPVTSAALRLRVEPSKAWAMQVGVFDAQAGDPNQPKGTHARFSAHDGFLLISEVDYLPGHLAESETPGKFGVGLWSYTRSFDHLSETVTTTSGETAAAQGTSSGAYFIADQNLSSDVSVFFRHGVASTAVNLSGSNTSGGFVFRGLVPMRPKDKFGIAFTHATPGEEYAGVLRSQGLSVSSDEMTYEANYRIELAPGVALQPDYQYVSHPGYSATAEAAQLGSLRLELSF